MLLIWIHILRNNTYKLRDKCILHALIYNMSLVYNNIYIKTSTTKSDMAYQSFMEDYTITSQKNIARTLSGSQGCYGSCIS